MQVESLFTKINTFPNIARGNPGNCLVHKLRTQSVSHQTGTESHRQFMNPSSLGTESVFSDSRDEIFAFLMRRLRCPETAADLAQETYLRLHQSERRSPADNPRALAFRIAANLVVDYLRKQTAKSRYESAHDDEALASETVPGPDLAPEQAVSLGQTMDRLKAALSELPVDSRTALLLNSADGLTYVQIAERLGVSERMVAKRIAQALKHCRDRLDDETT